MKKLFCFILVAFLFTQTAHAANCQKSLATIFSNEGGFQKMRTDSGNWTGGKVGKGRLVGTKYGIAAASYPKVDIPHLTLARAALYYERDYWNPLRLSGFKSQGLATTFLDTAVNCGVGTSGVLINKNVWLWKTIIAFFQGNFTESIKSVDHIPSDPTVEQETVEWMNKFTYFKVPRVLFYLTFQAIRSERYVAIAKRDPNKRRFLDDWLIRTWE